MEKKIIQSENRTHHRPIIGFLHIFKTAGTTVKFILRNSTYLRHCDLQPLIKYGIFTNDDFKFLRKIFFFGVRSISGHSLICPTAHLSAPIQYFTFVRDPLQRCLSHYQHLKRSRRRRGEDITFEEFIQAEDVANHQVRCIAGDPDLAKAKHELSQRYLFVGLTERFAESMLILQRFCPYPLKIRYTRRHVTVDNTAKQDVLNNPASRRLLEENNQLDQQLYTYVRDELYPSLREKVGLSDAGDINEKHFLPTSYPLCYKLTRGYNIAVYRSLSKLRRHFAG
jgi:hypothetical protein